MKFMNSVAAVLIFIFLIATLAYHDIHFLRGSLTKQSTILESQNPGIVELYVVQKRRPTRFEALKL